MDTGDENGYSLPGSFLIFPRERRREDSGNGPGFLSEIQRVGLKSVATFFSMYKLRLIYGPKRLFKYGEERSIVCYCTQEEKLNF